ncbi:hypothetical protein EDB81DRAFT_725151 [Dactylonectria macrodidyma]|uniref:BZIP domain-containing protein n=1 Tax=Dactylonectria macrodidyma TaxID=307937 RepID=A0A9P9EED6_9HYPO|nr:hypothetical protein EDB81DRAFT_725151 [Dactylonectria macrodidyma]
MDPPLCEYLPTVVLEPMPQQSEAKNEDEDWTGVTNTTERKKRQNRLHQRAYRKRRRAGLTPLPTSEHHHIAYTASNAMDGNGQIMTEKLQQDMRVGGTLPEGHLLLPTPESRTEVQNFAQRAYEDYSHGAPRLDHLNILIRLNVLNAISRNAALVGFNVEGLCCPELISPFNKHCPGLPCADPRSPPYPDWLRPTAVQVSVKHHPWIDLIPFPRMRDNILRALEAGLFDQKALGVDVLDVQDNGCNAASLIVWGDPWDPRGWEASVPFLQKWGGLLQGCPVLLESTNSWRQKRGERKIAF